MNPRAEILQWAEEGRVRDLRRAMQAGEALPSPAQWHGFLDRVLLFMGSVLLAASVTFFFAFNWDDLGRLAKLGIAQAVLLAALVAVWKLDLDSLAGKAALLFAALVTGALLALVGQAYQTGADPWQLFAYWAAAILPWALVARFPALWFLWLVLVNFGAGLHEVTLRGSHSHATAALEFAVRLPWLMFGINVAALVAWEGAAWRACPWLRERWAPRIIAVACGTIMTALAMKAVFRSEPGAILAWIAWTGALYGFYRHVVKDIFMLAGGALGAIVLAAATCVSTIAFHDLGGFFFVGLLIIGMSAAAGWWLRQVARQP